MTCLISGGASLVFTNTEILVLVGAPKGRWSVPVTLETAPDLNSFCLLLWLFSWCLWWSVIKACYSRPKSSLVRSDWVAARLLTLPATGGSWARILYLDISYLERQRCTCGQNPFMAVGNIPSLHVRMCSISVHQRMKKHAYGNSCSHLAQDYAVPAPEVPGTSFLKGDGFCTTESNFPFHAGRAGVCGGVGHSPARDPWKPARKEEKQGRGCQNCKVQVQGVSGFETWSPALCATLSLPEVMKGGRIIIVASHMFMHPWIWHKNIFSSFFPPIGIVKNKHLAQEASPWTCSQSSPRVRSIKTLQKH